MIRASGLMVLIVAVFLAAQPANSASMVIGNSLGVYDAQGTFLGYLVNVADPNTDFIKVFHPGIGAGFLLACHHGYPVTWEVMPWDMWQVDLYYETTDCSGAPLISYPGTELPFGTFFTLFRYEGTYYIVDPSKSPLRGSSIKSYAPYPDRICQPSPNWMTDANAAFPLKAIGFSLGGRTLKHPLSIRPITQKWLRW